MIIKRIEELDEKADNFVDDGFNEYASQNQINVNYQTFHFIAEDNDEIVGVATGYACYNEVYISELISKENSRKKGIGSKLLKEVENYFKDKGYDFITLTTYDFQAPNFYLKNGYEIEYIRENATNPKLTRYYFKKMF